MTVPEMVHENDLFNLFSAFANVVHIHGVIPAYILFWKTSIPTCLRTTLRAFIALQRVETYRRSTMGQQRVSNIALIKTERAYANAVVNNDMDRIIDIFGRQNGKEGYFF